jgi:hypothetical protein
VRGEFNRWLESAWPGEMGTEGYEAGPVPVERNAGCVLQFPPILETDMQPSIPGEPDRDYSAWFQAHRPMHSLNPKEAPSAHALDASTN